MNIPRGTIVFIQSSGNPFTDFLTRIFSGSGVVHCGISLGDGKMINARGSGGVCLSNVIEGVELYGKLPDELIEPVIVYCEAQVGKPYDFFHLAADPIWDILHLNVGCSAPDKWICSTLIAAAVRASLKLDIFNGDTSQGVATDPFNHKPLAVITPQDVLNAFPQIKL